MAERYQFPLDDVDYYNGKVIFQVLEEIPPNVYLTSGQKSRSLKVDPDTTTEQSTINKLTTKLTDNVGVRGATAYKLGRRVSLYLPQGITFQDGVVYDEFALGRVGAAAEMGIRNGQSLTTSVMSAVKEESLSGILDLFNNAGSPDIARLAVAKLAARGPETIATGIRSGLQVAVNPNKRTLFKEVSIREFSFNFKLVPTSKDEAEMITSIVKLFREELYPDDSIRVGKGAESIPIGYNFPSKFIISFKHNDRNIAHKLLPAHLVNISLVYNPTGMGFFEDGNFSEVEITMNFRESRTLSKNDVTNEGY